jgi:dTDP-4-dehydrorhamnose 3,5-epimerase
MPMPVKVTKTEIEGVLVIETMRAQDDRGFFSEVYSRDQLAKDGFRETFVQDNLSRSKPGTLRGMHYQLEPHGMGKLVRAVSGSIFDVAVDLRRSSPTFGKWVGRELSAENHLALWVPSGFAHGFLALQGEGDVLVYYKCTEHHVPEAERAINYADPDVGIAWPAKPTLVSPKDAEAPLLADGEYNFA